MKKILIMIDSLTCGGAEKSLISLLPFIADAGHEITLMLRSRGGLFEQYVPGNIRIETFPYRPSRLSGMIYSLCLRMPFGKTQHAAELYWKTTGRKMPALQTEYDVAIAYQQGFPTFYVAEKVKAKKKICWVNVDLKSAGYSPVFCRRFYERFDRVAAVSDVLRDRIVFPDYVSEKSKVFTCWDILNEALIRRMACERNVKTESDNRIHITTVGRLVPLKGYDMAIKAARILKDSAVEFVWHFVGGGVIHDQLQANIKSEGLDGLIVLEGEQLNPYPYIAAADIYVQTSRFEGFGLTIGEAKILGKPIVSTNFPVVYNQITDGENGIVVDMTPESIAEGIIILLDDVELREKLIETVKSEHNSTAETESKKVISLIED